jgi:hypothetical protein
MLVLFLRLNFNILLLQAAEEMVLVAVLAAVVAALADTQKALYF